MTAKHKNLLQTANFLRTKTQPILVGFIVLGVHSRFQMANKDSCGFRINHGPRTMILSTSRSRKPRRLSPKKKPNLRSDGVIQKKKKIASEMRTTKTHRQTHRYRKKKTNQDNTMPKNPAHKMQMTTRTQN